LAALIPPNLRVTELNRGRLAPDTARKVLSEGILRGQKVVNYNGHGSANTWRGNLLTAEEATALTNRSHLSMFVMMTCLNGYFQDAGPEGLGEALLKAEGGGAVAVWASSGMTLPTEQAVLNQALYRILLNQAQAPFLGEAVLRAKASVSGADIRRTWILFGDPTMKLK
jgi:hypothetical protein